MPRILKKNNRVSNAKNFRDSLGRVDPTPDYLYLFFGKESVWLDEDNPDTPTEDITDEFETRNAIVGIKKISQSDTAFVVARNTWTSGTVYAEYDADDSALFTKAFYVITSNNNVYKCLDNNSGGTSIVEPTGTSTSPVSTGDGYQWKFMYNLSSSMISEFLTNDWLPVPTGGQRTSFQTAVESNASYSAGNPPGGHGSNPIEELGANNVMISQTLDKDESGVFPVNDDYRQFGLWKNPKLTSTGNAATGSTYTVNDSNSDINEATGSILYVDNRKAIARSSEQAESFKLVMTF